MKNIYISFLAAACLGLGTTLPAKAQSSDSDSSTQNPVKTNHKKHHNKALKSTRAQTEDPSTSSNLSDSGASPTAPVKRASDKGPFQGSSTSTRDTSSAKSKTAPTSKATDSSNLSDSGANPSGATLRKTDTSPAGEGMATGPGKRVPAQPAKPTDSTNLRDSGANPGSSSSDGPSAAPTPNR
jgi:hypothetical protein